MRKLNKLIIALMVIVIAAVAWFGWVNHWHERALVKVLSMPDGSYYQAQRNLMETYPNQQGQIVMLGDSHLGLVQWHELLNRPDILNRGIGGDGTEGVLKRLPAILALHPKLIVCQMGVNDIAAMGRSANQTWDTYQKILSDIKAANILIVLNTVPPLRYLDHNNPEINRLNLLIKQWAKAEGIQIIDLAAILIEDGRLASSLTYDGVHLNAAAYLRWKAELVAILPDPIKEDTTNHP